MTSMTWSGPDDAGGVLVDAEAEQRRVLGDEAEQPAEPVPLLEVLVDDDARAAARGRRRSGPSGAWASRRDAPNAIMWLLHRADAPARRAGDDRARAGSARGSRRRGASRRSSTRGAAGCRRSGRCRSRRGPRAPPSRRSPAARVTAWSGPDPGCAQLAEDLRGSARRPRGPATTRCEMTAIVASRPPASATNRLRMTRSRTLSSAPPMMMTVPSVTSLAGFSVGWR